jgi:PTH1 family peptidyl-tRNA hydrolase
MKLIVGLGNPGRDYHQTRHNAGFMALDRLVQRHGLGPAKMKFHAGLIEGALPTGASGMQRVVLMQPTTYMNRSGLAVGEAMAFFRIPVEDLLVLVDDIALPCGRIRLRATGSAGGHNGLKDIERTLSTRDYARLRIGIDPPGRIPQVDYVLGKFTSQQQEELDPALTDACRAIEHWLGNGIERTMTEFNG